MIELDNLNKDEKIFYKEFEIYNNSLKIKGAVSLEDSPFLSILVNLIES